MHISVTRSIDVISRSKQDFSTICPALEVMRLLSHLETRAVLLLTSLLLHSFAGVWGHHGDGSRQKLFHLHVSAVYYCLLPQHGLRRGISIYIT